MKNKLIVLAGPTGVGKTDTSLNLAKLTNSEIISCDSMQIYRSMDIGTAKASEAERASVRHHMIDIKSPFESYSVCEYVKDAKSVLADIFSRGKNAILVGGTGLYADSLVNDTDFTPTPSSETIRQELREYAEKNGADALHKLLLDIDAESAEAIHKNNIKRVIRAIEFYRLTGKRLSQHNADSRLKKSPYDYIYIGLTRNRDELYERIDSRVDAMMSDGLLDEVTSLYKKGCRGNLTSMQALGYKELIHYIEGRCTLSEAVRILKRDTRHYAKRQLTWFGRNPDMHWINLSETKDAAQAAMDIINAELK